MQMKTIRHLIYGIGIFLASSFAACSDSEEDIPVPHEDETCTLTIQLGAEGTAETRVGGDDNAIAGEFINTLWVFVVNKADNNIDAKFKLADGTKTSIDNATGGGNVLQWMRTEEGVPTGEKIIYAFANMDNVSTTETTPRKMSEILDGYYNDGGTINVDNLIISDPATNIDITNGKYIPMSLKENVTITGNQTIYVELIRLVGRVDVIINNSKDENISVQSLSMGELTNQVGLIKGVVEIPEASETKTQPLSESIAPNGTSKKISFYVNETGAEEYTVSLTATTGSSSSAETYSGTLQLSNTETNGIPRNHILPLNLNIGDSDFIIEVYVAPIGGYPRNIPTTSDPTDPNATSTVDVPEGCSLRVKDASTNRYYNLSVSSSTPAGIVEIGDDPQWAHITALQAEGNISIIADGTIIPLNIVPLADYALSGSLGWEMIPQGVLRMVSRPAASPAGHK